MEILKPLEDEFNERQQKKFRERVTTTRVVVYILAGISLITSLAALASKDPTIPSSRWVTQGIPGLVFIILMLCSYRKPYVCLLIATVLLMCGTIYATITFFSIEHEAGEIAGALTAHFVINAFMIRGTISARKLTSNKSD